MIALRGPISDRLRAQLGDHDPQWHPARVTAQTDDMPEHRYHGVELAPAGRTAAAR